MSAAPTPPAIRRAVTADAEALAALEAIAFPQPWSRVQLLSELQLPSALGLLVEGDAGALGYALFRRMLDEAELLRLAVAPAARRRGLASALVARGLAELGATGCQVAFLEVRRDNLEAVAFYERGGWAPAGRRPRYYPDGADALLYRRAP